jgi:hypothetical protein
MKKDGYFNKDKRRSKIKRKSNKPCFGCGEIGHFIADCPNPKNKNKNEKEYSKGKKKYSRVGLKSGTQVKNHPMMKEWLPWLWKLTPSSYHFLKISPMMKMTSHPHFSHSKRT